MDDLWRQKQKNWFAKRAGYPRFRQILLWTRDIGLVTDALLCISLAMLASPTVLTDNPGLHEYVSYVGSYFGAVHLLSVGAIYPEVSQLVFAVGYTAAIVPTIASFLYIVIYLLLDANNYKETRKSVGETLDLKFIDQDFLIRMLGFGGGLFILFLIVFMPLGDLGFIHGFGWFNGTTFAKSNITDGSAWAHMTLKLFSSRQGLGIGSALLIYCAVIFYSGMLIGAIAFYIPEWFKRIPRFILPKRTW